MRLLVTGASGHLGAYLLRELQGQSIDVIAWSGQSRDSLFGVPLLPVDLADRTTVIPAFQAAEPDVVIHTAALTQVGQCYQSPDKTQRINVEATAWLAELAADRKARLIVTSTDMVFDGRQGNYQESDPPNPLSIYGRSKLQAEQIVLTSSRNIVARISLLFGPTLRPGCPAFFDQQVNNLRAGVPIRCFADEWRTPLHWKTAAQALLALAHSDFTGLIHIGGPERFSRLEMGLRLARHLQVDEALILAQSRTQAEAAEPRPEDVSLNGSLWRRHFSQIPWPSWEEAMREMTI